MMCFVNYLIKTLAEKTNTDVTLITKESVPVKTSGWGNWYLIVEMLFHSTAEAFNAKSTANVYNAVCL